MPGDEEPFLSEGMDAYLSKPLRKHQSTKLLYNMTVDKPNFPDSPSEEEDQVLLNLEELINRIDGDNDLLNELIIMFRKNASEYLNMIFVAMDNKDFDEITRVTHTLKGMVANMSAISVAKCAYRVEMAAWESRKTEIMDEIAILKIQIRKTVELIENYVKQAAAT